MRRAERGFSLLELVAVLTLASLLLFMAAPGFYSSWKRQQDLASLREMAAALRLARGAAVTTRQRVRLFVDVNTGRYRLEEPVRRGALPGMRLADAHLVWQDASRRLGYIAFYGDGSSSGGRLALVDREGRRHLLNVEIITGKVTLKTSS